MFRNLAGGYQTIYLIAQAQNSREHYPSAINVPYCIQ
jgi:hypothetical protein